MDTYKILNQQIYFSNALEAQQYAKNNPGTVVKRASQQVNEKTTISPAKILKFLDRFIIAQDKAKKEIAVSMYYHNLRMTYTDETSIQNNGPIMLIGPTGSGKTYIVQKACEYIDTVFIHVDTSSMVSEGIIGYNIGKLAADIVKKAESNLKKAEYAVVFFDEVDKLFLSESYEYAEDVANQLLRFIEGTTIHISEKDTNSYTEVVLSTHKMQFILGGAFQWLLDRKQVTSSTTMGFLKNTKQIETFNNEAEITLEDLYEENVPKELLGRMHAVINLYRLSMEDYYQILTKSENSPLQEFINKITFHGDKVNIEDDVIYAIATYASKSDLGVRAIRQILKKLFSEALFLAPNRGSSVHHITYNKEDFF